MDGRFEIESVQEQGDNIVLFTSKMTNWSTTTCDSKGNCTTRYYCDKDNVTAFKINKDGGLVWASNLDRKKTYSGWNIYDVEVVSRNNKYYVIYGSSFDTDATKKNRKSKKSKAEMRDKFEYGVFDDSNGNYKKSEVVVNAPGIPKKERKSVDPKTISVIDNNFYVNSQSIKFKPGRTALYCVGALACPVLIYPIFLDGNNRKGTGNLGTIIPLK